MYGSHRNNSNNNNIGMIIARKRIVQMGHFFSRMKAELGAGIKNKNDYGRISSGHIIPLGDSQDIISFHFIVSL